MEICRDTAQVRCAEIAKLQRKMGMGMFDGMGGLCMVKWTGGDTGGLTAETVLSSDHNDCDRKVISLIAS